MSPIEHKQALKHPVVLAILDGWGVSAKKIGNAVAMAKTPVYNKLWSRYPHSLLKASGKSAGLPPKQDGNSEAGHMNIGAGRIVEQDSVIISKSINDGSFFRNPAFIAAINHANKYNSTVHLMGLLTAEQSAHADPDHLIALLTLLRLKNVSKVVLHLFTDGRDSYQFLAVRLLEQLEKVFMNGEKVATIAGRFYAMDRIKEWSRTEMVYDALVLGLGHHAATAQAAVLQAYNRHENDEYIKPTVIGKNHSHQGRIKSNDAVIFFNLRSDRVRELTKAFVQKDFIGFERKKVLRNLCFVSLTDFGPDLPGVLSAYPSRTISNTLPFALSGYRQLYVAETEKYAHITYFFNGGYDHPVVGEERVIINSPKAFSYRERPAMSADTLTAIVVAGLNEKKYDFIAMNYANADMVAHTGDLKASIKAVEKIDQCLGKLIKAINANDGVLIITADHGNIEELVDAKTGEVNTSHSSRPVPFILYYKKIPRNIKVKKGVLADIAPTILHLINVPKPKEMGKKILCQYQINQ